MSVMKEYTVEEIIAMIEVQEEREKEEREMVALVEAQEQKEKEEKEIIALVEAQEQKEKEEKEMIALVEAQEEREKEERELVALVEAQEREEKYKNEKNIEKGKEYKLILVLTQTTQSYITTMDVLNLSQRAMDEIYPLLKELVVNLKKVTRMYPFMFDGFEKLNAWLSTLEQMRASDELTDKIARKLLFEIEKSYASFMKHLQDDSVFLAIGQMVQYYITTMDALRLGQYRVDEIYPLMKQFVVSLESVIVIVPTFDGLKRMKEWLQMLESMNIVNEMNKEYTRQLLFDLDTSYSSFIIHLSDE
jgi:hypothetical protein